MITVLDCIKSVEDLRRFRKIFFMYLSFENAIRITVFFFFFFFEGPPWVWIYLLHFEETSAISLTVSHGNSKKYPLGKKPRMSSGNNNKGVK